MSVEGEDSGTPTSRSRSRRSSREVILLGKEKNTGGCDVSGRRKRGREERGREGGKSRGRRGVSIVPDSYLA